MIKEKRALFNWKFVIFIIIFVLILIVFFYFYIDKGRIPYMVPPNESVLGYDSEVLRCLSIVNSDVDYCYQSPNKEFEEECLKGYFFKSAIITDDVTYCDNLLDEQLKTDCLNYFGENPCENPPKWDIEFLENEEDESKLFCEAVINLNLNLCNSLKSKNKEYCQLTIYYLDALKNKNSDSAEKWTVLWKNYYKTNPFNVDWVTAYIEDNSDLCYKATY
jgi:hypothetical protein